MSSCSSFHYIMEAWGTGRTSGKKILAFVNSHHRHIGQSNEGASWLFGGALAGSTLRELWIKVEGVWLTAIISGP